MKRFTIFADGYDNASASTYALAADKAVKLCKRHECEVRIRCDRGIVEETFVLEAGRVVPKY